MKVLFLAIALAALVTALLIYFDPNADVWGVSSSSRTHALAEYIHILMMLFIGNLLVLRLVNRQSKKEGIHSGNLPNE
jgi:preprotein translocase subunit SecG